MKKKKIKIIKIYIYIYHRDKIIPHGLSVYMEPSIGHQGELFLETWHENL